MASLTDYAKMIFCLNELPKTKDQSNGYFRRFLILPFNVQLPKAKVDSKLAKRIAVSELPGIMEWVLAGRKRLIQQQGVTESLLCKRELDKYRHGQTKDRPVLILPD